LAGALQLSVERRAFLTRRLARLEPLLAAARSELSRATARAESLTTTLEALETTLGLLYPGVSPSAVGPVRGWAGRYGQRGALTDFIREHLQSIAPRGIRGCELRRVLVAQFALDLPSPLERNRFKDSVHTILRQLRDQHGVIESIENWHGRRSQSLWRWKQASTLDQLRDAEGRLADEFSEDASGEHLAYEDPIRPEVAAQRVGCLGGRDGAD
jgi:hypothetical protein